MTKVNNKRNIKFLDDDVQELKQKEPQRELIMFQTGGAEAGGCQTIIFDKKTFPLKESKIKKCLGLLTRDFLEKSDCLTNFKVLRETNSDLVILADLLLEYTVDESGKYVKKTEFHESFISRWNAEYGVPEGGVDGSGKFSIPGVITSVYFVQMFC